ncbi:hypothetical protein N7504_010485 [Penicillium tannophilum]|nr:hypothetical protein N7504_010485 [Penicillium tannophilum]
MEPTDYIWNPQINQELDNEFFGKGLDVRPKTLEDTANLAPRRDRVVNGDQPGVQSNLKLNGTESLDTVCIASENAKENGVHLSFFKNTIFLIFLELHALYNMAHSGIQSLFNTDLLFHPIKKEILSGVQVTEHVGMINNFLHKIDGRNTTRTITALRVRRHCKT